MKRYRLFSEEGTTANKRKIRNVYDIISDYIDTYKTIQEYNKIIRDYIEEPDFGLDPRLRANLATAITSIYDLLNSQSLRDELYIIAADTLEKTGHTFSDGDIYFLLDRVINGEVIDRMLTKSVVDTVKKMQEENKNEEEITKKLIELLEKTRNTIVNYIKKLLMSPDIHRYHDAVSKIKGISLNRLINAGVYGSDDEDDEDSGLGKEKIMEYLAYENRHLIEDIESELSNYEDEEEYGEYYPVINEDDTISFIEDIDGNLRTILEQIPLENYIKAISSEITNIPEYKRFVFEKDRFINKNNNRINLLIDIIDFIEENNYRTKIDLTSTAAAVFEHEIGVLKKVSRFMRGTKDLYEQLLLATDDIISNYIKTAGLHTENTNQTFTQENGCAAEIARMHEPLYRKMKKLEPQFFTDVYTLFSNVDIMFIKKIFEKIGYKTYKEIKRVHFGNITEFIESIYNNNSPIIVDYHDTIKEIIDIYEEIGIRYRNILITNVKKMVARNDAPEKIVNHMIMLTKYFNFISDFAYEYFDSISALNKFINDYLRKMTHEYNESYIRHVPKKYYEVITIKNYVSSRKEYDEYVRILDYTYITVGIARIANLLNERTRSALFYIYGNDLVRNLHDPKANIPLYRPTLYASHESMMKKGVYKNCDELYDDFRTYLSIYAFLSDTLSIALRNNGANKLDKNFVVGGVLYTAYRNAKKSDDPKVMAMVMPPSQTKIIDLNNYIYKGPYENGSFVRKITPEEMARP